MTKQLSIIEQLCFCTTRVETEDINGNRYMGTAFFLNLPINNKVETFVVTNKHVVKNMHKGSFKMTEADENGNPIHTKHMSIDWPNSFEQVWTFHPDPNVDLCTLPISMVLGVANLRNVKLFFRAIDVSLIPTNASVNNLDAVEEVLMIGYPNGLWDKINNMPIVRKGTTATDIKLNYDGNKEFLLDIACYPGSSGSPVLICNSGNYTDRNGTLIGGSPRVILLGVLYAGHEQTIKGEIKVIDVPIVQTPIALTSVPINLGIIIKSERLLDFIDIFSSSDAELTPFGKKASDS